MAEREDLSRLEGEKNPFNKYDKKYTSLKVWLITLASFVLLTVCFFIAKGLLPYTLTFDTLGGSEVPTQDLTFLEIMKTPEEIPTKAGYYFAGWTKDKENKTPFPFGDKIWWSTTAYAKWNDGVAIILEFAEGEENEDLTTAELKAMHEVWLEPGSAFELTSIVNTKQDSLHYGERLVWFEDEDCSGEPIIFSKTYEAISENITVYGKWFDLGEEGSFEVDENGVLTNYNGYCKNLMFPANVKSIRAIDVDVFMSTNDGVNMEDETQSVFKNVMSSVESIYLNDGLKSIDECAFYNCTKLKKVTFINGTSHSSLKTIDGHAFMGTKISDFKVPETTSTIGEYAFHGITELVTVDLGGAKTLGKCAFSNTSLEEITLEKVERIGPMAFAGCNKLKKMYLLSSKKIEIENVSDSSQNVLLGSGYSLGFKIYVPKDLKETYSNDTWWGMYSDKFITSEITTTTIDFSDKTYIAFGDSITFGADYSRSYAQMDNPYSKLVANTLGMKSFKNAGISGATLCTNTLGLVCISDIVTTATTNYDVISLLGGVNDFNRELPLGSYGDITNTTIYGSLDVIAKYLTTNFSNSFIFFMTPYKTVYGGVTYSTNNSQGYNLEDVANAVKQVANKYSIPVLDLFNEGQFELEMYSSSSDGIHPSQEFITNYTAPQIVQFIKDNYK